MGHAEFGVSEAWCADQLATDINDRASEGDRDSTGEPPAGSGMRATVRPRPPEDLTEHGEQCGTRSDGDAKTPGQANLVARDRPADRADLAVGAPVNPRRPPRLRQRRRATGQHRSSRRSGWRTPRAQQRNWWWRPDWSVLAYVPSAKPVPRTGRRQSPA